MRQRLISHGIPAEKIRVAENWADGDATSQQCEPPPSEGFSVLYSGNLGVAHDALTICGAMTAVTLENFTFIWGG